MEGMSDDLEETKQTPSVPFNMFQNNNFQYISPNYAQSKEALDGMRGEEDPSPEKNDEELIPFEHLSDDDDVTSDSGDGSIYIYIYIYIYHRL